jgi:flagellar hook-associated protein 1
MSTFSGLQTGLSGLLTHRQVTETISHNIANVNTPGYSRQRVELQAEGRQPVTAIWSRVSDVGQGVRSDGISRIRNEFLETQHRNEAGVGAALAGTGAVINRLESVFPEPSDTGVAAQLREFWASWESLVNNPGDLATRAAVMETGNQVVQVLRRSEQQIDIQREDALTNIGLEVSEVNQLAEQVAKYNSGIRTALVGGQQPNDLLDQRDQLILRLSELTGATVETGENGMADVYVGGRALVHGQDFQTMKAVQVPATDPKLVALGLTETQVQWRTDSYPADVRSGEIAGYVAGVNDVLPDYQTRLNEVATKLATTVNDRHKLGQDLNGAPGQDFFTFAGTPSAATIKIGLTDPAQVVAGTGTPGSPNLETSIAEQLGHLGKLADGADANYQEMILALGNEVQFFTTQTDAQAGVVNRLDEDRKAASGVNLDEEMVNLVAAQHAYSAAARVITTVDEMLETIINRMGTVGR